MLKKLSGFHLIGLCVVVVVVAGCNKRPAVGTKSESKAFESASPKLKTDWETVCTAAAATNYVTVILTGRKMQGAAELTAEQRAAVNEMLTELGDQMTVAAQKGDATALKAIEEIRKGWR